MSKQQSATVSIEHSAATPGSIDWGAIIQLALAVLGQPVIIHLFPPGTQAGILAGDQIASQVLPIVIQAVPPAA